MNLYLDNIVYSLQTAGGISVYWYEFSKRLLASNNQVCFIEEKEHQNIFRKQLSIPSQNIIQKNKYPVSIARYLPVAFKHPPGNSLFHSSYYRIPANKKLPSVVTVHDFTYEKMKTGIRKQIHQIQKKGALEAARGIICISEHTKADMLSLYPHLNKKKIAVIYNGVSDSFHPLKKNDSFIQPADDFSELINKPYAIFIGGRETYKNFSFSVDAIRLLTNHHLVIIGGGQLTTAETDSLNQKLNNRWHFFVGIDNEKLNKLYNFARFLLYPSAYEGFGIPVIEAEKAGCPVIALEASSIPEIAGNKTLLLQSLQVEEFLQKAADIESNRNIYITKGFENSRQYSWDKCYMEIIGFYETVLQD